MTSAASTVVGTIAQVWGVPAAFVYGGATGLCGITLLGIWWTFRARVRADEAGAFIA